VKHLRILLPLLILALLLAGCTKKVPEPYDFTQGSRTVTVYPATSTMVDGLDVYTYQVEKSGNQTSYVIDYPNGAIFQWTATKNGGAGGWSGNYNNEMYLDGNFLVNAIEEGLPREKTGSVGLGLLLMALGAVNFFLPELPFYLRYGWAVENAQPSEAYLTWAKIGGAVAAVLGLIWCIL